MISYVALSTTVANCAFTGNAAGTDGGGMSIHHNYGPTVVANCTFSGNAAAAHGGGVAHQPRAGSPGEAVVSNCVLWGNSPDQIVEIAWTHGDSEVRTTVNHSDVQGSWHGPGGSNISADPVFADPAAGDYRLGPGSPCIDAGDNTAVPEGITTDLDGNPRFVDDPNTVDTGYGDPPIVDMGAFEYQASPFPWGLGRDGNMFVTDLRALVAEFGLGP